MASASGQDSGGIISGINVTPLVDVMLVLLVIFIVTAKIIVTPAVPLDLPHAAHGEEVQVVFSVAVPIVGPVLVNGEPSADDVVFSARASEALARNPSARPGITLALILGLALIESLALYTLVIIFAKVS